METKQIIDKVVLGQGLEYNYLGTVYILTYCLDGDKNIRMIYGVYASEESAKDAMENELLQPIYEDNNCRTESERQAILDELQPDIQQFDVWK